MKINIIVQSGESSNEWGNYSIYGAMSQVRYIKARKLEYYLFSIVETPLKSYQTDEAMSARAKRKADKKLCKEKEEVGKYRAKYKKQMELHRKAFGLNPFAPFWFNEINWGKL